MERETNQQVSELKSKQQAEIEARKGNVDQAQLKLLLQAHASALEEAENELYSKQQRQKDTLEKRLAKMRKDKTEKLGHAHDNQLSSERTKAKAEAEEQAREKDLEAEKEAAIKLISETDNPNSTQIVEAILARRHKAEIAELNDQWDQIRNERLSKGNETGDGESDAFRNGVENQIKVDYASDLLKLKERHYQEKLSLLSECAPAAARNAEKDAQRMALARRQIEIEKVEREEKAKADRTAWEEEQQKQTENELKLFEQSLATEIDEEQSKMQSELFEKRAHREKAEKQRKQKMEEELKVQLATKSQQDHTKLLRDHELKLEQMDEKRELDHKRMQEQIQKRLDRKRNNMVKEKEIEIAEKSEENEKDYAEQANKEQLDLQQTINPILEEPSTIEGPLNQDQLDAVLRELPVVGSLREIQKFLGKRFLDTDVMYGDVHIITLEDFDSLELINYRYALFLLKLFQDKLGMGKDIHIKVSENLPKTDQTAVTNEFSTDLLCDKKDIILKRRTLSGGVGQLSVLVSYGFALCGTGGKNLQNAFFETQSILMNDAYFILNATDRTVNTNFLES